MVPKVSGTYFGRALTANVLYSLAGNATLGSGNPNNDTPAASALVGYPSGVVVDANGNVFFSDVDGYVRVIAAKAGTYFGVAVGGGNIATVAGNGSSTPADG